MDKQIDKIVDGMVASGVPREQAIALAMSITHSLASPTYTEQYGTFLRTALLDFLETAGC
jgi:hypothetical protein